MGQSLDKPVSAMSTQGMRGARRAHPLMRSTAGLIGIAVLGVMMLACLGSLPYTLGRSGVNERTGEGGSVRYNDQDRLARHLPPTWAWRDLDSPALLSSDTYQKRVEEVAWRELGIEGGDGATREEIASARPLYLLGTDLLGRSLLIRCLAGGGISLSIGLCAAMLSVCLGALYGSIAGYVGGRVDAVMMRVVDVLYGLPYILLVVLFAVAVNALLEGWQERQSRQAREDRAAWVAERTNKLSESERGDKQRVDAIKEESLEKFPEGISQGKVTLINIVTLLAAIGGVSWLTMARVVRGQVMSLKSQPFMEAARAMGVPVTGIFLRHLLPNLVGPIVVYATLTVPQAILQESFLSFLGIGVKPPMPSWGSLAAEGLTELNPFKSHWWLILFPCLLLAVTLLALNFVGEGLREALDPKRRR